MEVTVKLGVALCLCVFGRIAVAGSVSYVVLQDLDQDSLVRVSADGKQATTIANGAAGVGLTVDRIGNYIVAARHALLRVTPAGVVTTIAFAPGGSRWVAVAADPGGDFIVADGSAHVLWRVTEDGRTVTRFTEYPGKNPITSNSCGLLRDDSGDFLLLRRGDDLTINFYRITPTGIVSRIPLTGAVRPPYDFRFDPLPDSQLAVSGGPMISDGSGAFLFVDNVNTGNIFRLTIEGVVTKLSHIATRLQPDGPDIGFDPTALARNPDTGEIIVTETMALRSVSAAGSPATVFRDAPKTNFGTAILAEVGRWDPVRIASDLLPSPLSSLLNSDPTPGPSASILQPLMTQIVEQMYWPLRSNLLKMTKRPSP